MPRFPSKRFGWSAEGALIALKCIHFARTKNISIPLDAGAREIDYWRGLLLKRRLESFMLHQNEEVGAQLSFLVAQLIVYKSNGYEYLLFGFCYYLPSVTLSIASKVLIEQLFVSEIIVSSLAI